MFGQRLFALGLALAAQRDFLGDIFHGAKAADAGRVAGRGARPLVVPQSELGIGQLVRRLGPCRRRVRFQRHRRQFGIHPVDDRQQFLDRGTDRRPRRTSGLVGPGRHGQDQQRGERPGAEKCPAVPSAIR